MTTPNLSILLYHRIAGDREKKAHSVPVAKFKSHMAWLKASGHDVFRSFPTRPLFMSWQACWVNPLAGWLMGIGMAMKPSWMLMPCD